MFNKCDYCGEVILEEPIVITYKDFSIELCDTPCLEQFASDIYDGFITWEQWPYHVQN